MKGLTIHDRGRTYKIIRKTFEDLGYKVFDKILNSKDFGVPQNRERIYLIAFRNDIAPKTFEFPEPTDTTQELWNIREEEPVPAKYYLSTTYLDTLVAHKNVTKQKETALVLKSEIGATLQALLFAAVWVGKEILL